MSDHLTLAAVQSATSTQSATCKALFIAAPSSGQGKTTVTAALARLLTRQGMQVHVFKTGPDYLDPQILERASGHGVQPLDLWMAGEHDCKSRLYNAAQQADVILIEGAMGLFDGEPSSADLAATFQVPVALLMDVKGMAQTAAAIAIGLANYRSDLKFAGLIANRCGSARHRELIENALPDSLPLLANLPREESIALPERHLGLVQASEYGEELDERLDAAADWLEEAGFAEFAALIPEVTFQPSQCEEALQQAAKLEELYQQQPLAGVTIAVARDEAFSFIYQANVQCLESLGAQLTFFSPLRDAALPEADALWLPGGYPELHARALSQNLSLLNDVRDFAAQGKTILGECGGMLYCLDGLTDGAGVASEPGASEDYGERYPMAGVIPGEGVMRGKRGCQGMQTAPLPEGDIRGHAHHRSRAHGTPEAIGYGRRQRHPAPGEAVYRVKGVTASYLHLFFPSNPKAVAALFSASIGRTYRETGESYA